MADTDESKKVDVFGDNEITMNPDQLDVGLSYLQQLEVVFSGITAAISANVNQLVSRALEDKVNLESVCSAKMSKISSATDSLISEIEIASNLARNEYELVLKYSTGDYDEAEIMNSYGMDAKSYLAAQAGSMVAFAYPSAAGRVVATLGMAGFKFGEGFTAFFEGLADGAISIAGAGCQLVGADEYAKNLKDASDYEFAVNLWENNKAFEWINRNSYFDKDSLYAKLFYKAGEATAAALTAKGVSSFFENAEKGKKALEIYQKVGDTAGDFTDRVQAFEDSGFGPLESVMLGALYTTADTTIDAVTDKAGEGLGNVVSTATGAGEAVESATDMFTEKAEEIAGNTGKAAAKKTSEWAQDKVATATSDAVENVASDAMGGVVETVAKTYDLDETGTEMLQQGADIISGAVGNTTSSTAKQSQKTEKSESEGVSA